MKKLYFLSGALLAAVLAGGRIVESGSDGYDYHALVHYPDAKDPSKDWKYQLFKTENYAEGKNEFVSASRSNENGRVLKLQFETNLKVEAQFKEQYPRLENMAKENQEEENAPSEVADRS